MMQIERHTLELLVRAAERAEPASDLEKEAQYATREILSSTMMEIERHTLELLVRAAERAEPASDREKEAQYDARELLSSEEPEYVQLTLFDPTPYETKR